MSSLDERTCRVALSAAVEPGHCRVLDAVTSESAQSVYGRLRRGDPALDPDGRLGRRIAEVDPERLRSRAEDAGARFVVPGDAGWPSRLDDLSGVDRERRGGVPVGLWVRGSLRVATRPRAAAVVGSRAATSYGVAVAADWAAALAERDVTVVSGAAYGIDAAAHRGALAVDGATVAILAGGLDQPYPRGNAMLIERIAERGCLLSEAAPGSAVNRSRFLSRNRLIAALTGAALVVEAGARSGALSTARWALHLMRPLAAVPGPVTSAMSLGSHQLIRDYGAVLVCRPEEMVELVGELGADASVPPSSPDRPVDSLEGAALTIHEAMPARDVVTVAELMAATGLAVPVVLAGLNELAGRGFVEGSGDLWRLRPRRRVDP